MHALTKLVNTLQSADPKFLMLGENHFSPNYFRTFCLELLAAIYEDDFRYLALEALDLPHIRASLESFAAQHITVRQLQASMSMFKDRFARSGEAKGFPQKWFLRLQSITSLGYTLIPVDYLTPDRDEYMYRRLSELAEAKQGRVVLIAGSIHAMIRPIDFRGCYTTVAERLSDTYGRASVVTVAQIKNPVHWISPQAKSFFRSKSNEVLMSASELPPDVAHSAQIVLTEKSPDLFRKFGSRPLCYDLWDYLYWCPKPIVAAD